MRISVFFTQADLFQLLLLLYLQVFPFLPLSGVAFSQCVGENMAIAEPNYSW